MSKETHMLPVWFFIGVLLAIYGVIILVMAVVDFNQTSQAVLAEYHPGLFGGVLLILLGGFYTFWFWPGRRKKN
jgi:FtsH-binding integral membrane protein